MTVLKLAAHWYKLATGLFSKHPFTPHTFNEMPWLGKESVPEIEKQKDDRFWPESPRDTRSPGMA